MYTSTAKIYIFVSEVSTPVARADEAQSLWHICCGTVKDGTASHLEGGVVEGCLLPSDYCLGRLVALAERAATILLRYC